MQSLLPDINSKYLMYTRKILDKIESKKWGSCAGALNAINALLPEEYHVIFSTIEHNKQSINNIVSICEKCKEEIDFKSIKIMELIAPVMDEFLSGSKIIKIWICPKCKQDNKLSTTKIITRRKQMPNFLKVVPAPPERKDGIADRRTYDVKMEAWVWGCLEELEHQMGKFRKDNWKAGGEQEGDLDIDTTIEEGKELVNN